MTAPSIPAEMRADQIGPVPLVLAHDSWQARLVRKAEALHRLGKPVILLVKLGDCVPNWFRTVADGT